MLVLQIHISAKQRHLSTRAPAVQAPSLTTQSDRWHHLIARWHVCPQEGQDERVPLRGLPLNGKVHSEEGGHAASWRDDPFGEAIEETEGGSTSAAEPVRLTLRLGQLHAVHSDFPKKHLSEAQHRNRMPFLGEHASLNCVAFTSQWCRCVLRVHAALPSDRWVSCSVHGPLCRRSCLSSVPPQSSERQTI